MSSEMFSKTSRFTLLLALAGALGGPFPGQAEPTITSPPPATGASPSAPFVFTFSEPMNTDFTGVDFIDTTTFITLPTTVAWSSGDTVLTCTPSPAFPANRFIVWSAYGENIGGDPLGEPTGGFFTTGTGSGGGGSGTNAITSFTLGIVHSYEQTSSALPTLDATAPYLFSAITSLSSNRTATNVLLTLPTGSVSNLTQNFFAPETFTLFGFNTNLSAFNTTFPSGNYTFNVQAAASNQTVIVNFPPGMLQPGAPHLTNHTAAQSVNPAQPFVLGWDAFPGGTASDFIYVEIGDDFSSTDVGLPGALTGTARTFTIPAGTLQPNTSYDSTIGFYRSVSTTNGTSYTTTVYRATITDFTLITGSGTGGALLLTNAAFAPALFSFDVLCSPGQIVTVEYRTNLAVGQWQTLLTTNSPGSSFRAVAPQAATNRFLFFRARSGP